MSRYILNSDTFIKLDDPPGIVENISGFKAEIYYSPTATTGVILYPFQSMPYTVPLWACKEQGEEGTAVLATIPYNGSGAGSGTSSGGGTTYIDDDDYDDCCGCGCNVNISVTTNTNTNTGCGCGCCDTPSATVAPVTLPSGDCDCGCSCHCGGSDTAVVTLPAEICDCQTISGGKKNSCKNKGGIELNMPIVINIPNYIPVMPSCGCGNSNKSSPSDEEDSTDNKSLIDEYFADKDIDGGTSGNLTSEIDKYFSEKEI